MGVMDLYVWRRLATVIFTVYIAVIPDSAHFSQASLATWMYIGMVSSNADNSNLLTPSPDKLKSIERKPNVLSKSFPDAYTPTTPSLNFDCESVTGLVDHQIALCRRNAVVFSQLRYAAKWAIDECQYQFRNDRWNCSTTHDKSVFGKMATKGTKETAFITAISSAAVAEAVIRACSMGIWSDCSCDTRSPPARSSGSDWKWSGCSDNVEYGLWFSRQFNDAPEEIKRKDARSVKDAMNLHNKAAGRAIVYRSVEKRCRCHGVSGSCELKTCWKKTSSFRNIGTAIKMEHRKAVPITKKYAGKLRRRGKASQTALIASDSLVYLERSPDYCQGDPYRGVRGTFDRTCNATFAKGPGSCADLCCGRGHHTQVTKRVERCHCKFIYCCEVKCRWCENTTDIHTCK